LIRFIPIILLFLVSCSREAGRQDDVKLARVHDQNLYLSDLQGLFPEGIGAQDSINIQNSYINSWINQQLMLHKAMKNLPSGQKDFDKQLEEYKNSLIIYRYKSELIRQNLDTIVPDTEIEAYYNANIADFELQENIVRVWYVKLKRDFKQVPQVRRYMRSENAEDIDKLEKICISHAENYFLDENKWLYFNDLLKEIPIQTYNQEAFLRTRSFVEIEDDPYLYLLRILDFKTSESTSPLSLEKNNIRNIIINKRKIDMVNRLQDDIYQEATASGDYEIFQ
jgi:hypothetical protein